MTITKNVQEKTTVLVLEGRLDTTTAPQLDAAIKLVDTTELVLDFEKLEYISSAGLRVLLAAQKTFSAKNGRFVVRSANADVREVFEITGFSDILTLE